MSDPVADHITSYHELNAGVIDELFEQPSPLEFMRYVAKNRPFVVRRAAADWDAAKKWDATYLLEAMEGEHVNVAVTPSGNADAVLEQESGSLVFVEPYEQSEQFSAFLDYVQNDMGQPSLSNCLNNVKYAQTRKTLCTGH